ncbi:MAG TPA: BON domain-containing protein [Burkholderiaceae bacterium]|nr:BON domain-containing protein [Burkholderiaceae bacterium]
MAAIATAVAALGTAGCGQREQGDRMGDQTVGQSGREMGQSTRPGQEQTTQGSRSADQGAPAGDSGSSKIGDKVSDAVITTTVKAEMAKDSSLSAMRINVDTDSGRVVLRGTAPNAQARDHATALASSVKGVVSVDNQLTIEPGKS